VDGRSRLAHMERPASRPVDVPASMEGRPLPTAPGSDRERAITVLQLDLRPAVEGPRLRRPRGRALRLPRGSGPVAQPLGRSVEAPPGAAPRRSSPRPPARAYAAAAGGGADVTVTRARSTGAGSAGGSRPACARAGSPWSRR